MSVVHRRSAEFTDLVEIVADERGLRRSNWGESALFRRVLKPTSTNSTNSMLEWVQLRETTQKTVLILDGHPGHTSKKVQTWAPANSEKPSLHILPAYSSELHPDERLNPDVRTNEVIKKRTSDKQGLKKNLRAFLHSRQNDLRLCVVTFMRYMSNAPGLTHS